MLCVLIWALAGRGESLCFMKQDHNLVMVTTIQTHTIRSSASDRKFYSSKGYQLDHSEHSEHHWTMILTTLPGYNFQHLCWTVLY